MSQHNERHFAYGDNSVDNCACPAIAAGYNPNCGDMSLKIAEKYDEILRRTRSEEGTIEESVAKEAWLDAVDYFVREAEQSDVHTDHYHDVVSVGRDIADEHGWL